MKPLSLEEMEDYIDSLNLDNVVISEPKVTISSPNTVFERGYNDKGLKLYTKKYDKLTDELDLIAVSKLNDKGQIILFQVVSHLKLIKNLFRLETYTYDDKDRLIYYKKESGSFKMITTEWEKYKYKDNKNLIHLTYRNSKKNHVKIKMDKDNNILEYEDDNHNWWDKEAFSNTNCPFNIIPLEKQSDKIVNLN